MAAASTKRFAVTTDDLASQYRAVRQASVALIEPLSDADANVQSMPDASPAKWHLAHTTWFFETMVLVPHRRAYRVFDERYDYLFNSYYEAVGARQPPAEHLAGGVVVEMLPADDEIDENRRKRQQDE